MDQLDQFRKSLPIFNVRNKLISEIQRNPTLVLLGKIKIYAILNPLKSRLYIYMYSLLNQKQARQVVVKQPKYRNTSTKPNRK